MSHKILITATVVVLLAALVFATVASLPAFRISKISIEGQIPGDVSSMLRRVYGKPMVGRGVRSLERALKAHPLVSDFSVDRSFPGDLEISLSLRNPDMLFTFDDDSHSWALFGKTPVLLSGEDLALFDGTVRKVDVSREVFDSLLLSPDEIALLGCSNLITGMKYDNNRGNRAPVLELGDTTVSIREEMPLSKVARALSFVGSRNGGCAEYDLYSTGLVERQPEEIHGRR